MEKNVKTSFFGPFRSENIFLFQYLKLVSFKKWPEKPGVYFYHPPDLQWCKKLWTDEN
jgi:hypothetical protein